MIRPSQLPKKFDGANLDLDGLSESSQSDQHGGGAFFNSNKSIRSDKIRSESRAAHKSSSGAPGSILGNLDLEDFGC